jgi:hypothetical protein
MGFLAAVVAVFAVAVPGAGAGNSQTFLDSTGENASAPDITSVAVSNDDAGLLTFKVNISNRPALSADMEVDLYLNTDGNGATGDPQGYGADYAILLVPGEVDLYKWNGSDYAGASSQSSLVYSYDASGATIKISASELGGTKAFGFFAVAASGVALDSQGSPDYTHAAVDLAPDAGHGTFAYTVLTKLELRVATFHTTPKSPRAGGTLSASMAVTENDTGAPLAAGAVACRARVGGKAVPLITHLVTNGVAACVWRVPNSAKGKKLTGKVVVSARGASEAKSFHVKIRQS